VQGALRSLAGVAIVALACAPTSAPPPEIAASLPPEAPAAAAPPAPVPVAAPVPSVESHIVRAKGWSWLVSRLAADGVDIGRAERAFADPRMPAFDGLFFSIDPAERRSLYGGVLRSRSIAQARACAVENASAFAEAERATGVPAELVASILHIETRCGRNTGNSIVLYGLARLAMANEPENVAANLERRAPKRGALDAATADRVRARALVLDGLFYPEVRAVFTVAERWKVEPLALRGSRSGAFGYGQFLPTSYLRFGTDGNGDGKIDLYSIEDAAASTAAYLASHGWEGDLTRAARRQVIWHYNRSDAYIDAVLALSDKLHGSVRRAYAVKPAAAHPQTAGSVPAPAGQ
jgi:membrane-bound lytic murein transglycosylase B